MSFNSYTTTEKCTRHADHIVEGFPKFKCPECGWIFCEECSESWHCGQHGCIDCPSCDFHIDI